MVKLASLLLILFSIVVHGEDISLCKEGWRKSLSKNYQESLILFKECIKNGNLTRSTLARTYRNIGITLKNNGQYNQAIENYNKALSLKPLDPWDDYINRGNAWSEKGDYTRAFSDYKKALEVKPNYGEVYYNRGIVFEKQGDYKSAILEFKRAYKLGLRSRLLHERFIVHKIELK